MSNSAIKSHYATNKLLSVTWASALYYPTISQHITHNNILTKLTFIPNSHSLPTHIPQTSPMAPRKEISIVIHHHGQITDDLVHGLMYSCANPIFLYVNRSITRTQLMWQEYEGYQWSPDPMRRMSAKGRSISNRIPIEMDEEIEWDTKKKMWNLPKQGHNTKNCPNIFSSSVFP